MSDKGWSVAEGSEVESRNTEGKAVRKEAAPPHGQDGKSAWTLPPPGTWPWCVGPEVRGGTRGRRILWTLLPPHPARLGLRGSLLGSNGS